MGANPVLEPAPGLTSLIKYDIVGEIKKDQTEMGRSSLGDFEQLILLAIVRVTPNAYGVTIREEISKRAKREVSIGAIYTTLERLEEKGYVSSWRGEPTSERGGRAKRFFDIRAAGVAALEESLLAVRRMSTGLRIAQARP